MPWQDAGYTITQSRNCRESLCELLAIEAALNIAKTEVENNRHRKKGRVPITRVSVFSDASFALEMIMQPRKTHADRFAHGTKCSAALENMGVCVELRWVPARSGVEGNMRADKVAGWVRKHGPDFVLGSEAPETPMIMRLPVPVLREIESPQGSTKRHFDCGVVMVGVIVAMFIVGTQWGGIGV